MTVQTKHVTYLETVGVVSVSESTEYRVSYARTPDSLRVKASVQIWWKGEEDTWKPGKGFVISTDTAYQISRELDKVIESQSGYEGHVNWTDSQQYVITRDPEKDLIILCKRWHKGDFNWVNGKSIALNSSDMHELSRHMRNCHLKRLITK